MNPSELKTILLDSNLFSDNEIEDILNTCGTYTIGNAIIACEVIGIALSGNDIDVLISL